ncbi:hypothetical protein H0H92_007950 [Tricholoma furcatifolium]|nr:hypothetical protein H0H92_007950 [Tricholoma furcatifolium]
MSSTAAVVPLRGAVLGSLFMTWAWGVIAGSVGLNALIKSNQQKSHFRKVVGPSTHVDINTNDAFKSGIVLTTVSALIAVLTSIFLLLLFANRRLFTRTLRIQSLLLAFCALWLFATQVPFTDFFANRSAKVTATIDGIAVPQSVIQGTEKLLGTTSIYRHIGYLRLVAILPWITLLFTIITSVVLFVAGSRAQRATAVPADAVPVENTPESPHTEKYEKDEKTVPEAAAGTSAA